MTRFVWLLIALAAALAAAAESNPLAAGSRLCVLELGLPANEEVEDWAERATPIEARIRDALEEVDYEVVDGERLAKVLEATRENAGGFVDSATGERNWPAYRAYLATRAEALSNQLGCQAILDPNVVVMTVSWEDGYARWGGRGLEVQKLGTRVGNFLAGFQEFGTVGALSLHLNLQTLEGESLAYRVGAIELLARRTPREWVKVPPEQLLTDTEQIDLAIGAALGPEGKGLREEGSPAPPGPR